jgi:hypothetical protein
MSGPLAMNVPPGSISRTIEDLPIGIISSVGGFAASNAFGNRSVPVRHRPDASSFERFDAHAAMNATAMNAAHLRLLTVAM